METEISRRALAGLAVLAIAVAASGCASSSSPIGNARVQRSQPDGGGFAWLHPAAAPRGWHAVRIASAAVLAYPPGWRILAGDPGTATAALQNEDRAFVGYLNLTPREGDETLKNWPSFRLSHSAGEGDRNLRMLATASGLRFRRGRGACIRDSYTTTTGARYVELACLVAGRIAESVIVGAAPPWAWVRMSPVIERAISALIT
jgi:hypothetical protein